MKKITKILLPIASTVAVAAPMTCLASCASAHYKDTKRQNLTQVKWTTDTIEFEAKKTIEKAKISAHIVSLTFPLGVELGELSGMWATADEQSVIIFLGGLRISDDIKDGATIRVTLHLTATDNDGNVVWEEKKSTFNIVHDSEI